MFMMRRATRRRLDEALDGLGGVAGVREQVFWGWGEPGAGPALPAHADAFLREELGLPGGVVEAPVALADVRLRAPALPAAALRASSRRRSARSTCSTTPRRACCAAAARATSTCSPSARATARRAPDAVVRPRRPRPGRRRAARVRGGRRGGRAVRRRHERGRRPGGLARGLRGRRLARPRADGRGSSAVDERSLTAVLEPGAAAAGGRAGAAARTGCTLAHVPAELRVGDGRRLRRHALGRPVLDRARPHRRERRRAALRDARRASWPRSARPRAPPGRRCASCVVGSEGALGVITRVALRVRPLAPEQPLRGLVRALVRRRLRGAAAARAGRAWRPTSRGCPTRPRRG